MDAQQIAVGSRSLPLAFVAGATVGVLGGMVGLGGAAFARYSRARSFVVLRQHAPFAIAMILGSVAGTVLGGLLLDVVSQDILIPALALLLVLSSVKVWRHR